MIRAVLFDLDDTLYEERQFFRSGFEAVEQVLRDRGITSADDIVGLLEHFHHQEGREGVFQKLSERLAFPSTWIPDLVRAFREHTPNISLIAEVPGVLDRLRRRYRLGCITDGWSSVQRGKLLALGVERFFDAVVVSDDYGREMWKPHAFPFRKCCELLGVDPSEAIFVGDHPDRDVTGATAAGLRVVRLKRPSGYFAELEHPLDATTPCVQSLTEFEALVNRQP